MERPKGISVPKRVWNKKELSDIEKLEYENIKLRIKNESI